MYVCGFLMIGNMQYSSRQNQQLSKSQVLVPYGVRLLVRVEQGEEEEDLGVVQLAGKVHEDVVDVLGRDLLPVAGAAHHLVQPVDQPVPRHVDLSQVGKRYPQLPVLDLLELQ